MLRNGVRLARVHCFEDAAAVINPLTDRKPQVAWNQWPGFIPLQIIKLIAIGTLDFQDISEFSQS